MPILLNLEERVPALARAEAKYKVILSLEEFSYSSDRTWSCTGWTLTPPPGGRENQDILCENQFEVSDGHPP